ncbi:MAG: PepSY-associated TM helix domain-containing protein [Agarilytica sp.]
MSKHRKHKKRNKLRKSLTKWHKRIGLTSALIVILLSVSGVLLNHTHGTGLDRHFIGNSVLLHLYRVPEPSVRAFPLNQDWALWAAPLLFHNEQEIEACEGELVGALLLEQYWVAACSNGLALMTQANELIEVVHTKAGLPQPIQKIGSCHPQVCVLSHAGIYEVDLDSMTWQPLRRRIAVSWSEAAVAPAQIEQAVKRKAKSRVITWEKLMLDIHAGRFLGAAGPWVLDLFALFFCFFAISGIYIWNAKRPGK